MSAPQKKEEDVVLITREYTSFSVNVILTTMLFLTIFTAGTSWTMVVTKAFEGKPCIDKYWLFAVMMTLLTIAMALGFGALARFLNTRINVNITSLLGATLE